MFITVYVYTHNTHKALYTYTDKHLVAFQITFPGNIFLYCGWQFLSGKALFDLDHALPDSVGV